jgi:hypothetical protein
MVIYPGRLSTKPLLWPKSISLQMEDMPYLVALILSSSGIFFKARRYKHLITPELG